jgi:hypothetical protein
MVNLDIKQETKETLNDLINKIENIMYDGMNTGNNKIPQLFMVLDLDIMVIQQEVEYNSIEYENIKEILDY